MKNGGVLQQYVYFTILIFIKYNANSTYLFKLQYGTSITDLLLIVIMWHFQINVTLAKTNNLEFLISLN